ncbi:DUF3297 family protein [Sphingomonas prati]|uniref:DUF3297 domain-containing protein n=1 Tax=Sphingomonas prati TaxID=1843237 RepID=A0A7W9BUX8_9SPHN|nr:DUF3297 family protein [Sphingomonas prati]MBB5730581.1 hypothetical protein [Sphingomonas prati]GGE95111.1 hypothetical protein GCM10011404_30310 [Sphingomonas prati]
MTDQTPDQIPTDQPLAEQAQAASEQTAADQAAATSDTPPDRLSTNPKSPFFIPEHLQRGVGIVFNGVEKTNVDEYCISEGWVKMAVGRTLDRKGNPMTITLKGKVEPYYRDTAAAAEDA